MIEWQMLSRRFLHQQWRPCEGNGGWLRLPTWFFIFSDSEFSFYAVWLAAAIFGFHSAFQRMRSVNDLCKQCNDFGTFLIGHFCTRIWCDENCDTRWKCTNICVCSTGIFVPYVKMILHFDVVQLKKQQKRTRALVKICPIMILVIIDPLLCAWCVQMRIILS